MFQMIWWQKSCEILELHVTDVSRSALSEGQNARYGRLEDETLGVAKLVGPERLHNLRDVEEGDRDGVMLEDAQRVLQEDRIAPELGEEEAQRPRNGDWRPVEKVLKRKSELTSFAVVTSVAPLTRNLFRVSDDRLSPTKSGRASGQSCTASGSDRMRRTTSSSRGGSLNRSWRNTTTLGQRVQAKRASFRSSCERASISFNYVHTDRRRTSTAGVSPLGTAPRFESSRGFNQSLSRSASSVSNALSSC